MRGSSILRQATIAEVRADLPRATAGADVPAPQAFPPAVPAPEAGALSAVPAPIGVAQRESQLTADVERRLVEARERIEREVLTREAETRARCEQAEKLRSSEHVQRIAALDALLQGTHQAHEARLQDLEHQAIGLAFSALCSVLGPQPDREKLMADLIGHGVRQLRGQPIMTVRMHPSDLSALSAHDAGHDLHRRYPGMQWLADASLARASCCFDSERGALEAGLQTQLSELAKLWTKAVADQDARAEIAVTPAVAEQT